MAGRLTVPFNLFRNVSAQGHSVKTYAAKLLATADRMMDATGRKLVKAITSHNGIVYTVYINKTGPRPIYKVFVEALPSAPPSQKEQIQPLRLFLFLESGAYLGKRLVDDYWAEYIIGGEIRGQYNTQFGPLQYIRSITSPTDPNPVFLGSLNPTSYVTAPSLRSEAGESDAIYQAISDMPASIHSGKMRLWIQSLYGSNRTDFYHERPLATSWPSLFVKYGNRSPTSYFTVNYRGIRTPTLITTSNYRYFLINVNTATLPTDGSNVPFVIREMVPYLSEGQEGYGTLKRTIDILRRTLQVRFGGSYNVSMATQNKQHAVVEACLLSLLSPAYASSTIYAAAPGSGGIDFGNIREYGWHSTWGGAQTSAVFHYGVYVDKAGANRKVTTDFAVTDVEAAIPTFTAVMSATTPVQVEIENEWYIWGPGQGLDTGKHLFDLTYWFCSWVGDPINAIPNPQEYFTNLPVYGYYSEDDTWISVEISKIDNGQTWPDPNAVDWAENVRFCGLGSATNQWITSSSATEVEWQLHVGGVTVASAITRPGIQITDIITSIDAGNVQSYPNDLVLVRSVGWWCTWDPPTSTNYPYNMDNYNHEWCWTGDWGVYGSEETVSDPSELTGQIAVVVPNTDCDSIIVGRMHLLGNISYNRYVEESGAPTTVEEWQPVTITEIQYHEYLGFIGGENVWECKPYWTGDISQAHYARPDGRWSLGYVDEVENTVTSLDRAYQIDLWLSTKTQLNTVLYSEATGGSGDSSALGDQASTVSSVGFTLYGGTNPDYNVELEAFFTSPPSVCIGGINEVSLGGELQESAVFGTFVGGGSDGFGPSLKVLSDADYNDDATTLISISSFVGWA